jgi:hypothetical protein
LWGSCMALTAQTGSQNGENLARLSRSNDRGRAGETLVKLSRSKDGGRTGESLAGLSWGKDGDFAVRLLWGARGARAGAVQVIFLQCKEGGRAGGIVAELSWGSDGGKAARLVGSRGARTGSRGGFRMAKTGAGQVRPPHQGQHGFRS